MENLWNSIYVGRGRKTGAVWLRLRIAILHEFQVAGRTISRSSSNKMIRLAVD